MKYAKILENGILEYAPRDIPGVSNWIEDETAVLAAGYLSVAEVETPEGQYISGYAVENGQIIPVFTPLPEPTYDELRRRAYPAIEEQLDMLYWDKVNDTDNWPQTIAAIKAAYPKPAPEETPIPEEVENG
ncbi:MAG: hypothetical protein KHX55_04110 [Proteobacteria bacterium]|nr:hypothetical protein [Pseudomonadota bacterium]